jgi:hypothetical protein
MNRLDELFKKLEYYDHLRNTSKMTITPIPKPRNPGKVPSAYIGKKADSSGKFWERFLNFLEENLIFLVGIFLGSIIILNIFLTLILVIKYL